MTSSGGIIKNIESWPEYTLASTLVELGHEVTVLSSASVIGKHDAKKEEIIDGIRARRFNPIMPSSFFHVLRGEWDIVHMHHLGYLAPISSYTSLANKTKNLPSVFTVHGIYHDPYIVADIEDPFSNKIRKNIQMSFPYLSPWRIPNWFVHHPLKNSGKITALTLWEKNELSKIGVKDSKIDVVPNGINLDKYKKAKENKYFKKRGIDNDVLLFVGQPTKRKGWEYFLQSMPGILKRNEDVTAVFVGYRENGQLEKTCKELDINENVRFFGFLPEDEKIAAFKSATSFVLPTLYEGFGIVYIEAMAAGIPVVTTDVAGNREIIKNGENGLLVRPRNPKDIEAAVSKILESRSLRARIRKKNIKKSKEYDKRNTTKKMLETYESVIK